MRWPFVGRRDVDAVAPLACRLGSTTMQEPGPGLQCGHISTVARVNVHSDQSVERQADAGARIFHVPVLVDLVQVGRCVMRAAAELIDKSTRTT